MGLAIGASVISFGEILKFFTQPFTLDQLINIPTLGWVLFFCYFGISKDWIEIHQLYHVKIHQWIHQVASMVSGLYVKFCQWLKNHVKIRQLLCHESSTISFFCFLTCRNWTKYNLTNCWCNLGLFYDCCRFLTWSVDETWHVYFVF